MNARNWFLVAALIFLGLVLRGVIAGGIYTAGYVAPGITYQMNRFTGSLEYCSIEDPCFRPHPAR